jgi:hypothetical protein
MSHLATSVTIRRAIPRRKGERLADRQRMKRFEPPIDFRILISLVLSVTAV